MATSTDVPSAAAYRPPTVEALCRRIRPIAVDLVDAYAVPPPLLRAPDLLLG
ncbi:MAG TPA: hypothetical protein VHR85_07355 [Nocardioides sp.]|nr:hypothetical protein [Nocardioides sp.]